MNNVQIQVKNEKLIFFKILLLCYFIVGLNSDWRNNSVVWFGLCFMLSLYLIMHVIKRGKIKINSYTKWTICFVILGFISVLWTIDPSIDVWLGFIQSLIIRAIVFIPLSVYLDNEKKLVITLKCYTVATVITGFYMLSKVNFATLLELELGVRTVGEFWAANQIVKWTVPGAFCAFLFYIRDKGFVSRLINIIILMFLSIITLLTASRGGMISLTIGLLILILFSGNHSSYSEKFKKLFIILALYYAVSWCIANFPSVSNLLGAKLGSLLGGESNHSSLDGSSLVRLDMINRGLHWFKERFLFGYGIRSFYLLYGRATGIYVYAHQNFIELGVGLGITGLIAYYSIYFIEFTRLKRMKGNYPLLKVFFITLLITFIIGDYFSITYDNYPVQLFICLAFSFANNFET